MQLQENTSLVSFLLSISGNVVRFVVWNGYIALILVFVVIVLADNLIFKVARSLQQEIDPTGAQTWDAVLVSKYLIELREAKKQGRKERKH